MVFKGVYDAFLKYWLVVAIVALSVPILDDKKKNKKETKTTCFISSLNVASV